MRYEKRQLEAAEESDRQLTRVQRLQRDVCGKDRMLRFLSDYLFNGIAFISCLCLLTHWSF
jgi:hypothetical protein